MKKVIQAGIFSFIFLLSTPSSWGETTIGFVDVNKIIQQSAAGSSAMKELTAFKEKKNTVADAREKSLRKLQDQINLTMSQNPADASLPKQQRDYRDAVEEYNRLRAENQAEITKKDRELTSRILEEIYTICNNLKREKGYTYVFDKGQSGVIVFPPGNDITLEVIERYDRRYPSGGR
ncbi:MAG: OmpH family outer membrane protein [Deltaproteobacteria bacterium]|nr:OmpH family outer membrane protein [Deltaproteobacteria bacterium]